jgi:tetraacyldisaccharide 4'-kinase
MERHPESRRRLRCPVISIGNLSVGGTGKTPVAAAVTRWLIARGERPAVLSRGYGRAHAVDGVTVVSDGTRLLERVDTAGDEPLMLARQVPGAVVCVADDRYLAGVLAEQALGCTVQVLDDGFQHYALHRDLDVLVSGPGEIADGRALPVGRLREPMEAAARAHLLIVVGADARAAAAEAWTLGISESAGATRRLGTAYVVAADPTAVSAVSPVGSRQSAVELPSSAVCRLPSAETAETADCRLPSAEKVIAVAGIANPRQFFDGLRAQGWPLARECVFPDHHRFTAADIATLVDAVKIDGATLVLTTEKDAVRFEAHGALPFTLAAVPMTMAFDTWATVEGVLVAALARAREADRGTTIDEDRP